MSLLPSPTGALNTATAVVLPMHEDTMSSSFFYRYGQNETISELQPLPHESSQKLAVALAE